ncbi:MAG: UDP-2,4-diacetamido-2,4,6-trideoxy-beta-L-altropyranose hydrolase [Cyanobacteria bacterium]|nr:UDP-2,4-diacetamido-2,4,6-trideoxy-beta-L-altropyranose hydrolase [Cyanobacteriota bacterium]
MVILDCFDYLLIRADASAQIGMGHVMRCLALAQVWQTHQGRSLLVMANSVPPLEPRLHSEGIKFIYLTAQPGSLEDSRETIAIAHQFRASWIVVDGYQFNAEYQKQLKEAGLKVLFFDDYGHCDHYYADLILNQNIGAEESLYCNRENQTKLLLGSDYTLLRKEFLEWQIWPREIKPIATNILVTLGGGDPDNVTLKVLQALATLPNSSRSPLNQEILDIKIVVGSNNPHFQQLDAFCQDLNLSIKLLQNVTNMPELMAGADLAIAAGGSTNWELAFMGLPSLVITIADNQKAIAAELDRQGVIINLGWHQEVTIEKISLVLRELIGDRPRREGMSQKGRDLVDGNGAMRVVSEMVNMLA